MLENVRIALQRRRGRSFDFWRSERVLDTLNDRATATVLNRTVTFRRGVVGELGRLLRKPL